MSCIISSGLYEQFQYLENYILGQQTHMIKYALFLFPQENILYSNVLVIFL